MPPKTSNPPQRKGPAFKPPRPVKDSTNSASAAKRASSATAATKKAAPARQSLEPATLISSSDSEDFDPLASPVSDVQMEDVTVNQGRSAPAQPQLEPIPQKLLGRLLQEGFEDEDTKIHRSAMELTTKYMEIFVREAISRAVYERRDANKRGGGSIITDGFLQVEDLEKLGPQLVLDF